MGSGSPRTVGIADDDPSLRSLLRTILERAGYEVLGEAHNGLEAVEMAATTCPQFVVLDEQMPYLKGSDAARLIRESAPRILIVVWSGDEVGVSETVDAAVSKYHVHELPDVLDALSEASIARGQVITAAVSG